MESSLIWGQSYPPFYSHIQGGERPWGGQGPGEVLEREGSALVARLQAASGRRPGETVDAQGPGRNKAFPGYIFDEQGPALEAVDAQGLGGNRAFTGYIFDERGPALETARDWNYRNTIWTDGPRLDSALWFD